MCVYKFTLRNELWSKEKSQGRGWTSFLGANLRTYSLTRLLFLFDREKDRIVHLTIHFRTCSRFYGFYFWPKFVTMGEKKFSYKKILGNFIFVIQTTVLVSLLTLELSLRNISDCKLMQMNTLCDLNLFIYPE